MGNQILYFHKDFEYRKGKGGGGSPQLKEDVTSEHLEKLKKELEDLLVHWQQEQNKIPGALINICYKKIISKSSRLKAILSIKEKDLENAIVGARYFIDEKTNTQKHIFTYYIDLQCLKKSIKNLSSLILCIKAKAISRINAELLKELKLQKDFLNLYNLSWSVVNNICCDASLIESFAYLPVDSKIQGNSLISLYDLQTDVQMLLKQLGINIFASSILDNKTIRLLPNQLETLKNSAPYLIAMEVEDEKTFDYDISENHICNSTISIPTPTNEPIIGVIDSNFDSKVYFSEWVDVHNYVDDALEKDFKHGTAVTSLIVDGATINPRLDDGCGRFRVRHFAVAAKGRQSSFEILKNIKEIVTNNTDIKVWNLSLGSAFEVSNYFASPEAALLDELQFEHDIIFVVAGTNLQPDEILQNKKVGAPADSMNSVVVNAVDMYKEPASYTREGPVLTFFHKPDVSYYGGDSKSGLRVCIGAGEAYVCGTSYAAPWITRKLAYLIYILKFNRELAKALIIDSAIAWNDDDLFDVKKGYGVVPIKIQDIVESKADEIKLICSRKLEQNNLFAEFPVPIIDGAFPFKAKATLCYFPACSRNQGVDYTNTEVELALGTFKANGEFRTINKNPKYSKKPFLYEPVAREIFQKWYNVKHMQEKFSEKVRAKKVADKGGLWSIRVSSTERLKTKYGEGQAFGLVVTLKEINGKNRINEFINKCLANNCIVSPVDIKKRIQIYNKSEEIIEFDK